MATEHIVFKGKCKWFRPNAINNWGKWSHQLYLDGAELERFRNLGLKNKLSNDEDGWYTTFSRPNQKEVISKYGERRVIAFNAPQVIDKDGQPCQHVQVGNGSDISTTIEVYTYTFAGKPGKACRWLSSRIDNLIPFVNEERTPEEAKAVAALVKEPAHTW